MSMTLSTTMRPLKNQMFYGATIKTTRTMGNGVQDSFLGGSPDTIERSDDKISDNDIFHLFNDHYNAMCCKPSRGFEKQGGTTIGFKPIERDHRGQDHEILYTLTYHAQSDALSFVRKAIETNYEYRNTNVETETTVSRADITNRLAKQQAMLPKGIRATLASWILPSRREEVRIARYTIKDLQFSLSAFKDFVQVLTDQ
jgi:hypothetical protein